MSVHSQILINVCAQYIEGSIASGELVGRSLRIDGFGRDELPEVVSALTTRFNQLKVFNFGDHDENSTIGFGKAIRLRNNVKKSDLGFVLLVGRDYRPDSSLDDSALFVRTREQIFVHALGKLSHDDDVEAKAKVHGRDGYIDPESLVKYLSNDGVKYTGDLYPEYLGLLADNKLDADPNVLEERLSANKLATGLLMDRKNSKRGVQSKLESELLIDASAIVAELDAIKKCIGISNLTARPTYFDFANWPTVRTKQPQLILEKDLTKSPHTGWTSKQGEAVAKFSDPAQLKWGVDPSVAGLKYAVDLYDWDTGVNIASLGTKVGIARRIRWGSVITEVVKGHLEDVDPSGDDLGYQLYFQVTLIKDGRPIKTADTNAFRIHLEDATPVTQNPEQLPDDLTFAESLYRFAQQAKITWGSIETVEPKPNWDNSQLNFKGTDGNNDIREVESRLNLNEVLTSFQQKIADDSDVFSYQWSKQSAHIEPMAKPTGFAGSEIYKDFFTARENFLRILKDSGPVEILDFVHDGKYLEAANNYVKRYAEIASELTPGNEAGETQDNAINLASIDSVQVSLRGANNETLLLIPPTHPTTVGWLIQQSKLIKKWGAVAQDLRPQPNAFPLLEEAGPRSLVMATQEPDKDKAQWWTYLGNIGPVWQVFSLEQNRSELRSLDWMSMLADELGLGVYTDKHATFSKDIVSKKINKYVDIHPHIKGINVAALTSGDGADLLDTLVEVKDHVKKRGSKPYIPNLRIDAKQIGSGSEIFAKKLGKFNLAPGENKGLETLLDGDDAPFFPTIGLGATRLKDYWKDLDKEVDDNKMSNTIHRPHISVVGPSLELSISTTGSEKKLNTFIADGLAARPASLVKQGRSEDTFVGDWDYFLEAPMDFDTPALSSVAALNVFLAVEKQTPNTVALTIKLKGAQAKVISAIHEISDWVILADPMFSTEFFDKPPDTTAGPIDRSTVLLDYSPMPGGFQGSQVLVTTKFQGELENLENHLKEWGQNNPHGPINAISSISGRLLLKLSTPTRQVLGELHGLALSRAHIENERPGALVVPIDEHPEIFSPGAGDINRKRADLLSVWKKTDGTVVFEVVEVKWSSSLSNWDDQLSSGIGQTTNTIEHLKDEYLHYKSADLHIRLEQLETLLKFHRDRAQRHGVKCEFTVDEISNITTSIDQVQFVGSVHGWCPESDAKKQGHASGNDVVVYRMSKDQLRSYTEILDNWPDQSSSGSGQTVQDDSSSVAPAVDEGSVELEPRNNDLISTDTQSETKPDLPETEKAESFAVELGSNKRTGNPAIWTPDQTANGHFVLIGGSGAGKTTAIRQVSNEIRKHGVPVLTLDFHGDIDPCDLSDEDLIKFTYDDNQQFINPFYLDPEHYGSVSPNRVKNEFIEAWRSNYKSMGIQQANAVTGFIEEAFANKGITRDPETWKPQNQVDFSDIVLAFENAAGLTATNRATLQTYLSRYREARVFHGDEGIPVEKFLLKSHRLDLSALDEEMRNVVADVVIRRLFMLLTSEGPVNPAAVGRDKYRIFVVIDEAQKLLGSSNGATASIAKYTAEARKFGIGLLIATQLKDWIPNDVWGNVDTRFFMKALDRNQMKKNAKAIDVAEERLTELAVGQGLLFSGSQPNVQPQTVKVKYPPCS